MPRNSQKPSGSKSIALKTKAQEHEPKQGRNGVIPGSMAHGGGGGRSHRRRTRRGSTDAALRGGRRGRALLLQERREGETDWGMGITPRTPSVLTLPETAVVPHWAW